MGKSRYVCQECGAQSAQWLGKCPDCGKWNSMAEERKPLETPAARGRLTDFTSAVTLLSEVSTRTFDRLRTGVLEFDRMIGGGIVPGSLVLLGGSPGIGKSTLMLQ
ncbi:MAG: DNA repair protein RadA, partial [Bdellovibrionales bacterium]|nr:DNA repair protein RadA [Bdellovibrionales bacterium]